MFVLSEQRLCDQARAIRKNEWFTMVELEKIKRRETNADNEVGAGNEDKMTVEGVQAAEDIEREVIVGVDNNLSEEDSRMIKELADIMESGLDGDTRGLKEVDRGEVKQWTWKVNEVMKDIQMETITDTNKLIRAVSVYITRKVGLRTGKDRRRDKQELWWKRRIKGSIEELKETY